MTEHASTTTQPTLWQTIDERFERFLVEQPDVYPHFVELARQVKQRGAKHYSADAICQVLRWHKMVQNGSEPYKMSDHFTSRLARKAMAEHQDLAGFFELRKLRK